MSRPLKITLIAAAVVAFIVASLGVGRVLAARGAEQSLLEQLIKDQNEGRTDAVVSAIAGCDASPRCGAAVARVVAKTKAPGGRYLILQVVQGTKISAGASSGVSRIAWRPDGRLPIVECVQTRRTGSVVSGFRVEVLAVSKPIAREGSCPKDKPVVTGA